MYQNTIVLCGSNAYTATKTSVFYNIGNKNGGSLDFAPAVGTVKFRVLLKGYCS